MAPIYDTPFYRYHSLTKHSQEKLLGSPHFLDWRNQPNPFREYKGAEKVVLPRDLRVSPEGYFETLEQTLAGQGLRCRHRPIATFPANLQLISNFLFYSMAISAWKQIVGTDHRWALRANPSSGNLHPTETHLLVRLSDDLEPGLYHYFVPDHSLEKRATGNLAEELWSRGGLGGDCPPLLVCLTTIFWREAWKYRDRAFRYCHHDLGHALGGVLLSAGALGWRGETFGHFPDELVAKLLGLEGSDERPALLIALRPGLELPESPPNYAPQTEKKWTAFQGMPNPLSPEEIDYPSINEVYAATCLSHSDEGRRLPDTLPEARARPGFIEPTGPDLPVVYSPPKEKNQSVHTVIRKRRSAVAHDGTTRMTKEHLETILASSTRGFRADFQRPTPWQEEPARENGGHHLIHLFLYIHRVDDVEPGLYYFDRFEQSLVPLSLSDQRESSQYLSLGQAIAADGCFAVSMIADFNLGYELFGDRCYRYVHFEAGHIGQFLYLGAEALGYDSTGIGAFFDDDVNRYLNLPPGFEVVYHFCVGKAVEDPRLTTLPSYDFGDPAAR